jgi:plastocyanin
MRHRIGAIARFARIGIALGILSLSPNLAAQNAPSKFTVTMAQMRYGALPANVKVGDTIVWVNRDTVLHTVTARDRSFDLRIPPRKQAAMVVKKAGKFPFYCITHPAMRGTLSVAAR